MALEITAPNAFDEVLDLVGFLAQSSIDEQEDDAVTRLKTPTQEIVDIGA